MQLDSYNCAVCGLLVEETSVHLFAECSFARMCWQLIDVDIPLNCTLPELFSQIKEQLRSQFYMEAIILVCWTIWSARNNLIFRGLSWNEAACKQALLRELMLLKHRVKSALEPGFLSWISALE